MERLIIRSKRSNGEQLYKNALAIRPVYGKQVSKTYM